MERGTYTFLTYATDRETLKSAPVSSTITLEQGTQNSITNILIPPTAGVGNTSVGVGEDVVVSGETAPGGTVELFVRPAKGNEKKYTATAASSTVAAGTWEITIPGRDLSRGTYTVRARTLHKSRVSGYSTAIFLGVGEAPSPDTGNRSDINKDGKVNLVDFSIMLSFWNTDDPDADINEDGIVNLADFSIMLFNWTG
jgi:hypothetical protein